MKGNKKIYFSFFLTIIQIGIEVVIKVQNLTKTIFVVEHSKISHVFGIQNYCRLLGLFNIQNMYVFAANVSLAIPWRMLGFITFLDVLSLSK